MTRDQRYGGVRQLVTVTRSLIAFCHQNTGPGNQTMWHSEQLLTFYVEDGILFLAVAQTNQMALNKLCYLQVIFTFVSLP